MDGVLILVLILVLVAAFDAMALLWGTDSRDAMVDDHRR